jgi:hypothetical protein
MMMTKSKGSFKPLLGDFSKKSLLSLMIQPGGKDRDETVE